MTLLLPDERADSSPFIYIPVRDTWRETLLALVALVEDEEFFDEETSEDEREQAVSQLSEAVLMAMGRVGQLVMHVNGEAPEGTLPCDGTTFLRVDYPELYASLDPVFHVDTDHFNTPDLRFKVPLGELEGSGLVIGAIGGEFAHTLTVNEMPAHTHATLPHNHSINGAVGNIISIEPGVPTPSAIAVVQPTDAATVVVESSGSGQPHNIMQPYIVVRFAIYYR